MNVKKYRATTTREALEKIKNDLGEEAFVLETKQVRSRKFFGFGGENQIEVSAVAPDFVKDKKKKKKSVKKSFDSNRILNLVDDTDANPNTPKPNNQKKKSSFFNALTSRAEADDTIENMIPNMPVPQFLKKENDKKVTETRPSQNNEIETVEISSEAPKIVHKRKQKKSKVSMAEHNLSSHKQNITNNVSPLISKQDLEIIRAELREVKHSISTFASRQSVQLFSGDIDISKHGEIYDSPFYDSYIELTATGLKPESVRSHLAEIIPQFKQGLIKADEISETVLYQILTSTLTFETYPFESKNNTTRMAVIGATGVGKTTTIAKIAARIAIHENRRVELVTLDTYRIAAVEQLKTYAQIIGAGCHVVRSTFELDAVLSRFPEDATVLIDTTGKNPHDLADQYEVTDYLKKHKEIRKCLAVQATMNTDDGIAAMKKFEMYGADCLALTKIDETTKPGALIETISQSSLPLIFFCNGQRVPEDLHSADCNNFISQILHKEANSLAKAA